jgi:colanic acid biosynthesis glycosyl transferase WcaI
MGKKQGLDLLVNAARRLSDRSHIQFVFCGDGPYRQVLIGKVKGLSNVILLPFQPSERLNDLLNLADIHLLPQRAGAADLVMPSKLTGMLASGRAVLATAHHDTQLEKALQGSGIVVPPGDVDAFVSAILAFAGDRDLRLKLGQEARKYAVSHLSRNEILHRFEQSMLNACDLAPLDGGSFATSSGKLSVEESATAVGNIGDD